MDLVAENEELKRRLALAENALCDQGALERAAGASDQRYRTLFARSTKVSASSR